LLEERDAYFSKLKSTIEVAHSSSNEKVLLLSHSYGSLMCQYFFNWVSSAQGAGADEDWVDAHVYAYSNIAGPMLGVPKAVSAMLSGQFRESAELGSLSKALDTFLSPEKRAELIRSWSSLWSMLPRGGDRIWGNVSHSPEHSVDGPSYWESMWAQAGVDSPPPKPGANFTGSASGEVIRFSTVDECDDSAGEEGVALARELEIDQEGARAVSCAGRTLNPSNLTAGQAVHQLIATRMPSVALSEWDDVIAVAAHVPDLRKNPKYQHARYFTNPLTSPLPSAPHMRIFCLYGVGQPAERNYMYKRRQDVENDSASVPYVMDNSITASGFRSGVQSVDGDGSVPLVSLGYMCVEGWKNAKYPFNPAKIPITTVEYLHMPQKVFDGRGGGSSANHVDIMGHNEMILHIMLMAAGHSEKVEERILSNVREMSANVNLLEGSSAPTWSDSFEASHFYRDEL
jgi:phospholipid:diacylglycerol acyltransferase